jgi:hypothetical protein
LTSTLRSPRLTSIESSSRLISVSGDMLRSVLRLISVSGDMLRSVLRLISVSGDMLRSELRLISVSGDMLRSVLRLISVSGDILRFVLRLISVSGDILRSVRRLISVSGDMLRSVRRLISVSGDMLRLLPRLESATTMCKLIRRPRNSHFQMLRLTQVGFIIEDVALGQSLNDVAFSNRTVEVQARQRKNTLFFKRCSQCNCEEWKQGDYCESDLHVGGRELVEVSQ